MRKGQLEIMGLAIIIILFVLGIMFALSSLVKNQGTGFKQEFTQTQLTSNFGLSLMQTSTPRSTPGNLTGCRDATLQDLMADCAENYIFNGSITCDNGLPSCNYFDNAVTDILNETLVQWVVPYHITVDVSQGELLSWNNLGCVNTDVGKAEYFTVPTSSFDTVTLKIFICSTYNLRS